MQQIGYQKRYLVFIIIFRYYSKYLSAHHCATHDVSLMRRQHLLFSSDRSVSEHTLSKVSVNNNNSLTYFSFISLRHLLLSEIHWFYICPCLTHSRLWFGWMVGVYGLRGSIRPASGVETNLSVKMYCAVYLDRIHLKPYDLVSLVLFTQMK